MTEQPDHGRALDDAACARRRERFCFAHVAAAADADRSAIGFDHGAVPAPKPLPRRLPDAGEDDPRQDLVVSIGAALDRSSALGLRTPRLWSATDHVILRTRCTRFVELLVEVSRHLLVGPRGPAAAPSSTMESPRLRFNPAR